MQLVFILVIQLSLDKLSMKFERVSHKLWYINRSRLEVFKIEITLQLHHMFIIYFKMAIWISYLEAEHSPHFCIIFRGLLIFCNRSVFDQAAYSKFCL